MTSKGSKSAPVVLEASDAGDVSSSRKPIGIIAGSGALPRMVVDYCKQHEMPCFVIGFEGETSRQLLDQVPHLIIHPGQVGKAVKALKDRYIQQLVLVGRVGRPDMTRLKADFTAMKLLKRLISAQRSGDDQMFRIILAFLEDQGFSIMAAQEVMPGILASKGQMGAVKPELRDERDIRLGMEVTTTLGQYDIGQAVVTQAGRVLGVEGPEGTDALIARAGAFRQGDKGGVLVKTRKPGQDERIDLPTVGPDTVQRVYDAGLTGIVVEAGGAILIDRQSMIDLADRLGVFLVGVELSDFPPA